jgi:hypothetical protein
MSSDILANKLTGYALGGNGLIPVRGKDFRHLHDIYCLLFGFTEPPFHVIKWLDCDADCHLTFVPRSVICGALPPCPIYTFVV